MPTNSIWFQVVEDAQAPDIGWQIKVVQLYDYDPSAYRVLAYVDEYIDLTISQELNGTGSASVTFDVDSVQFGIAIDAGPAGKTLTDARFSIWEAYQDGVLRFQWFPTSVTETILDEEGTRGVTVSGPGAAHVLTWAKVMPPGYPDEVPEQIWPWTYTTPAMQVWSQLMRDAQLRRIAPYVVRTFTSFTDSAGQPWVDVTYPYMRQEAPAPELGTDMLYQLQLATGQQTQSSYSPLFVEWVMWPGWQLDVRPSIGVDRSNKIIFFEGQVQTVDRSRSREEIANIVIVRDDYGQFSMARDNASIATYGRREFLQQHGSVTDKARRDALALNLLRQMSGEKSQWTVRVPSDIDLQKPFVDFNVGDWIAVSRPQWPGWPGENIVEKFRVLAISVRVTVDGEELELTLESLLEHRQRQLQRQLDVILNTIPKMPSTPPPTQAQLPAIFEPSPTEEDGTVKYAVWNPMYLKWQGRAFPAGIGGGTRVWIQSTDPGSLAAVGDFWYQIGS